MKTDATPWLHEVAVPTLVLAGDKDKITPALNQKIFHKLIPAAEFHLIKEGSHCPQMEKPELVNEIIGKFLVRLERPVRALKKKSAALPKKLKNSKKIPSKKTKEKAHKTSALR
jgi:predicted dienelactone hydrolase